MAYTKLEIWATGEWHGVRGARPLGRPFGVAGDFSCGRRQATGTTRQSLATELDRLLKPNDPLEVVMEDGRTLYFAPGTAGPFRMAGDEDEQS
ncbi:hypothetical protein GCM10023084_44940 [Streptomyces lacrimifluminis]|uniref:Uncharacterized protein n=1 Tax=Streptomyces lacrimifluminis TaxID=1500077 RepID=A0A917L590_9ACTN|nr:hypothetical protein [Streptomyces lacrimifluminis]GGJ45443.1 hypothetical protein GCM10012282_47900 [Streptomyces lacrimifluminis]